MKVTFFLLNTIFFSVVNLNCISTKIPCYLESLRAKFSDRFKMFHQVFCESKVTLYWPLFSGLLNFKKGMAILILALVNYLLDIVSPGDPTMFKAGRKMLGFGVPRWLEKAFPSLVSWTYQYAKAPHFLYYLPQNTYSPSSLISQLLCESKFLSHLTALSLTPGSTGAFFFEWSLRGSWFIL